jgi:hypothetical protein
MTLAKLAPVRMDRASKVYSQMAAAGLEWLMCQNKCLQNTITMIFCAMFGRDIFCQR